MPHISFNQLDKAAQRIAQEWDKAPKFVNQLCRALKYEADRRKDPSVVQPADVEPAVWTVWSRWISQFGLDKAREAAEQLSDIMFVKGKIK